MFGSAIGEPLELMAILVQKETDEPLTSGLLTIYSPAKCWFQDARHHIATFVSEENNP